MIMGDYAKLSYTQKQSLISESFCQAFHEKRGSKFIDTSAAHMRAMPSTFLIESFSPKKMAEMSTLMISTEELSRV